MAGLPAVSCLESLANQFLDRLVVVEQTLSPAGLVGEHQLLRGDPQIVVQGCEDLQQVDRSFLRILAQVVGRADRSAKFHPSPRQQDTHHFRPVVTTAVIVVNPGGTAEFAPDDDGDILVEPAIVQVLDQGGDPVVEHRQGFLRLAEVVAVPVVLAEVHRHATSPGFDEPSGDQKVLEVARRGVIIVATGFELRPALPITGANLRILARQVQSIHQPARGEDAEPTLGKLVHRRSGAAAIGLAAEVVEVAQEAPAVAEAVVAHTA